MFVVGTAGHVDHGKSTLVRRLTGIDPDRLREEQERAMTIDLGFAWLTLPSGREISLVDVPGHERFIKNMLAGVGGIDAAMLVVAADEGPMPQTAEHLAILDLLHIEHGLVVLTKIDLVDEEWLALVQEEVRERLRGTTLAAAPLVPVSALTGAGLDDLRAALDGLLVAHPEPVDGGRPRLPIDRVFTIAGFGTVVTGTLTGGSLRLGDEVEIQPAGLRARIRGLQSHKHKVEVARPSSRVAVNLSGVAVAEISRGDVLTAPGWLRPSDRLDGRLRLIADAPRPLEQNDRVDLFVGAAEVGGRVTLLDAETLAPGAEGWVQLRLDRPIAATRGDRFILRQPSPSQTIGGGVIVEAHPRRHRRFDGATLARLATLQRGTPAERLVGALAAGPAEAKVAGESAGLAGAELREALDELQQSGEIVIVEPVSTATPRPTDYIATREHWQAAVTALRRLLAQYHAQYPLRPGAPREEVRSRLGQGARLFDKVATLAARQGHLVEEGPLLRLPDHQPTYSDEHRRQAERLLAALGSQPAAPPSLPELGVDAEVVAALAHEGHIVKINDAAAFLTPTYRAMVDWTLATIDAAGSVTVAGLRDRFATSRKHALALLEHLDARRVTRRQGDARVRW